MTLRKKFTINAVRLLAVGKKSLVDLALELGVRLKPTGKILKRELRAPYWAGRDRQVN